jgi:hypothetical protein
MSKDNLATIPNDLVPIPECAKLIGRSYTSVYSQIRKGNVTVHFIAGDRQAKVSLSEAQKVFKTVPRKFSAPTFRIVRHGEDGIVSGPEAQTEKSDLFAWGATMTDSRYDEVLLKADECLRAIKSKFKEKNDVKQTILACQMKIKSETHEINKITRNLAKYEPMILDIKCSDNERIKINTLIKELREKLDKRRSEVANATHNVEELKVVIQNIEIEEDKYSKLAQPASAIKEHYILEKAEEEEIKQFTKLIKVKRQSRLDKIDQMVAVAKSIMETMSTLDVVPSKL